MSEIDDLEVYEAIYEAGDNGLTSAELAERFGVEFWAMHDVCLKLRGEGSVKSRTRSGTNLHAWVRREPDPLDASSRLQQPRRPAEPFI